MKNSARSHLDKRASIGLHPQGARVVELLGSWPETGSAEITPRAALIKDHTSPKRNFWTAWLTTLQRADCPSLGHSAEMPVSLPLVRACLSVRFRQIQSSSRTSRMRVQPALTGSSSYRVGFEAYRVGSKPFEVKGTSGFVITAKPISLPRPSPTDPQGTNPLGQPHSLAPRRDIWPLFSSDIVGMPVFSFWRDVDVS